MVYKSFLRDFQVKNNYLQLKFNFFNIFKIKKKIEN